MTTDEVVGVAGTEVQVAESITPAAAEINEVELKLLEREAILQAQKDLLPYLGGKLSVAVSFPKEYGLVLTKRLKVLAVYSDDRQVHYGIANVKRDGSRIIASMGSIRQLLDPDVTVHNLSSAMDIIACSKKHKPVKLEALMPFSARNDPQSNRVFFDMTRGLTSEHWISEFKGEGGEMRYMYSLGCVDNSKAFERVHRFGDLTILLV